jgi:hypothetical protein
MRAPGEHANKSRHQPIVLIRVLTDDPGVDGRQATRWTNTQLKGLCYYDRLAWESCADCS